MRAADIKSPGLYRYRRDSDQPWKFAQVAFSNATGLLEYAPVTVYQPQWATCSDAEKGEFHGPVDPDPFTNTTP